MACENMLPALTRHPLDFRFDGEPAVSVVIVCSEQVRLHYGDARLASRQLFAGAMQVVLIDNGSRDDVRRIEDFVLGLEIIRYKFNSGFVDACNAGLERARADTTLYLEQRRADQRGLGPQRAAAVVVVGDRSAASAARSSARHGKLQEAGSIIWRDGWATGYLRNADPNLPEANFVRVGRFLLRPRS